MQPINYGKSLVKEFRTKQRRKKLQKIWQNLETAGSMALAIILIYIILILLWAIIPPMQ